MEWQNGPPPPPNYPGAPPPDMPYGRHPMEGPPRGFASGYPPPVRGPEYGGGWYDGPPPPPGYGPPPPPREGPPYGDGRQGPPPPGPPPPGMYAEYRPPARGPPYRAELPKRPPEMYPPPPSNNGTVKKEQDVKIANETMTEAPGSTTASTPDKKDKKGDPLRMLAKVSSAMGDRKGNKGQEEQQEGDDAQQPPNEGDESMEQAPNQTEHEGEAAPQESDEHKVAMSVTSPNRDGPEPLQNRVRSSPIITPSPAHGYHHRPGHPKPITPTGGGHYYRQGYYEGPPPPPADPYYRHPFSGYDSRSGSWEQPPPPPVIVEERSSFDSHESSGGRHPPPPPDAYDPRYYPDWDRRYYDRRGPPPPPYGPPRGPPYPPPPYYDERASPYPRGPYGPYGYAPQPPPQEEKTVLRKKFSWKHYPELERFLIENRDDYLKFSSRNYTVEQKQFNNMLTERLISLAEKNGYVFDPDDFNFVAIRDRIRCYYKSYVQTARKRGLMLPSDKTKQAREAKEAAAAAAAAVKTEQPAE